MEALCGADLAWLVSARLIFPPSTESRSALSSAQTPSLSNPSVFHVAWGTLAGSLNELAIPPLLPPPAFASSPYATC